MPGGGAGFGIDGGHLYKHFGGSSGASGGWYQDIILSVSSGEILTLNVGAGGVGGVWSGQLATGNAAVLPMPGSATSLYRGVSVILNATGGAPGRGGFNTDTHSAIGGSPNGINGTPGMASRTPEASPVYADGGKGPLTSHPQSWSDEPTNYKNKTKFIKSLYGAGGTGGQGVWNYNRDSWGNGADGGDGYIELEIVKNSTPATIL